MTLTTRKLARTPRKHSHEMILPSGLHVSYRRCLIGWEWVAHWNNKRGPVAKGWAFRRKSAIRAAELAAIGGNYDRH